jgi:hypothetical protein
MVPIMVRLYPSEGSYARQQAEHLLNEVLYYLPFTYSITQTVHFSCFLHIENSVLHIVIFFQSCVVLGVMQIEIFVPSILF